MIFPSFPEWIVKQEWQQNWLERVEMLQLFWDFVRPSNKNCKSFYFWKFCLQHYSTGIKCYIHDHLTCATQSECKRHILCHNFQQCNTIINKLLQTKCQSSLLHLLSVSLFMYLGLLIYIFNDLCIFYLFISLFFYFFTHFFGPLFLDRMGLLPENSCHGWMTNTSLCWRNSGDFYDIWNR